MTLSQRVLGAVDLAIEFATLGEYGLEQVDLSTTCRRERADRRTALSRRGCDRPLATANCLADAHVARR